MMFDLWRCPLCGSTLMGDKRCQRCGWTPRRAHVQAAWDLAKFDQDPDDIRPDLY